MTSSLARFAATLAALFAATGAAAFDINGRVWPDGDITMHLQLGPPPGSPLSDGATSWDAVAAAALTDWNAQLARSRFVPVIESTVAQARRNNLNNVFFSGDVYGTAWGSGVLGVTISQRSGSTGFATESDVLFNANRPWDSYRGALHRVGTTTTHDLRRVALHEFGHVLGLDHPNEADPPQSVTAIMNSSVSNLDTLQADDIAGVKSLYEPSVGPPTIVAHPSSRTVPVTGAYTFAVAATGTGPFTYSWGFRATGATTTTTFRLATGPSYTIGSVQPADAGTYTVAVTNALATVVSSSATLTVTPIATSPDDTLANISTRGAVGTGGNILIAGLVVGGAPGTAKNVVVRAVGPALADFGVAGALADPEFKIVNNLTGATVAQNDNWQSAGNAALLTAAFARVGAFQFKAGSRDAALLLSLPPGNYTALVSGVGDTTGVALVEAYDADPDAATARARRFANIATRGQVGTGDDVLIAGLVVSGPGPHTYLIRAVGPTLGVAPFGLTGVLNDPFLQIYQGETLLRENDDWDTPLSAQPALRDAATAAGAFALQIRRDAAMIITLQPGNYTAKVSGFGATTGLALVEIYELP